MDLANWAFNAIDNIFSTRRSGNGEIACPHGTDPVGYVQDSWGDRRPLCLAVFSVEDVEDVYLFGYLVLVSLLIAAGGYLFYHQIKKIWLAVRLLAGLPNRIEGLNRSTMTLNQQMLEMSRKLDPRALAGRGLSHDMI